MRRDHWRITLEAYIDGELPPQEAASFLEWAQTKPEIAAELASRLSLRQEWQEALTLTDLTPVMARPKRRRSPVSTRIWIPVALAACLVLALGITRQMSPRGHTGYQVTIAGQVSALRFGEHPNQTLALETSYLELPAAPCR